MTSFENWCQCSVNRDGPVTVTLSEANPLILGVPQPFRGRVEGPYRGEVEGSSSTCPFMYHRMFRLRFQTEEAPLLMNRRLVRTRLGSGLCAFPSAGRSAERQKEGSFTAPPQAQLFPVRALKDPAGRPAAKRPADATSTTDAATDRNRSGRLLCNAAKSSSLLS